MKKFSNEVYVLVDEEYMSNFTGRHLEFMKEFYYKAYVEFCFHCKRKTLTMDEFYSNMRRRRIQLHQLCCPYCGSILLMIRDKKISGTAGYNYCPNCGRASAVENIKQQVSRFIRIHGINRVGLKEFRKTHEDAEEWLLAYDCYQMELISLASIIEVVLRGYFEALLFINNLGIRNSYIKQIVQKHTGNDFMNIEKANNDFKKAYGIDIKGSLDKAIWLDFLDVVTLRNMMIHNNGRVDERFMTTSTYKRNKEKVIDNLYKLEDTDIAKYLESVILGIADISNLFLKHYYELRCKVIANYYFNASVNDDEGICENDNEVALTMQ